MERRFAMAVVVLLAGAAAQQAKPPMSNLTKPSATSRPQFAPGLRLTIENPQVRVFRLQLPPHGSATIDRGVRDYVLLAVSEGSLEVGSFTMEMAPGEPAVLQGGWAHTIRSRSDKPTSWVLVETISALHPEQAVCGLGAEHCSQFRFGKGDGGEYEESLLFETGNVKLSRIQLGAASNLPTHRDRLDHLVIAMADCKLQVNGGTRESKAGDSLWLSGAIPEFRNAGTDPVRLVMVEMK